MSKMTSFVCRHRGYTDVSKSDACIHQNIHTLEYDTRICRGRIPSHRQAVLILVTVKMFRGRCDISSTISVRFTQLLHNSTTPAREFPNMQQ